MTVRVRRVLIGGLLSLSTACGSSAQRPLPDAVRLTTASLPSVAYGREYSAMLTATGGNRPYRFSIAAGALPTGIDLASNGALSGVAGEAGTKEFTVKVEDTSGSGATAMLSIRVIPETLEIVNRSLPAGREGVLYDQTLTARGGVRPYAWTISSGALPPGVELTAEGHLMGTPTAGGAFTFTLHLADNSSMSAEQALSVMIASAAPMIVEPTVPKARTNVPYELRLTAGGGQPPYSWDLVGGTLPAGLQLAADGVLAGTPTEPGDFQPIVRVTDSQGKTDMVSLALHVIAPLVITTPAIRQIIHGRPYDFQFQATGGELPYIWSLNPGTRLPMGIAFNAMGQLSGLSNDSGDFPLTVRVRDNEGVTIGAQFTLSVAERFTYRVEPTGSDALFPPACTSTTVSYQWVDIPILDSYQIADLDLDLDVDYNVMTGQSSLRIVLFAPDGSQAVLCGNDAGFFSGCQQSDLRRNYDDQGGMATRPERPFSVFNGMNPIGTWRLLIATVQPVCGAMGTIHSVSLSIADDRSTESFVVVKGWDRNNLVTEPFIHVWRPDFPDTGVPNHELFLSAAAYDVGPNGYREAGLGDDVLQPVTIEWDWQGAPLDGVTLTPDGHVTIDSSGACPAHCLGTGQTTIVASGGGFVATTTLRVTPPDFNSKKRRY